MVELKELRRCNAEELLRRREIKAYSALPDLCVGNPPVTDGFRSQRPGTRSFDVFFDLHLTMGWANNREHSDSGCHRAHYDVTVMSLYFSNKIMIMDHQDYHLQSQGGFPWLTWFTDRFVNLKIPPSTIQPSTNELRNLSHPIRFQCSVWKRPGDRLNKKIPSYRYKDSHYKGNTVSRPSYLYNGNSYTWKYGLQIEKGPSPFWTMPMRMLSHSISRPCPFFDKKWSKIRKLQIVTFLMCDPFVSLQDRDVNRK